jgi:hypothetical protein
MKRTINDVNNAKTTETKYVKHEDKSELFTIKLKITDSDVMKSISIKRDLVNRLGGILQTQMEKMDTPENNHGMIVDDPWEVSAFEVEMLNHLFNEGELILRDGYSFEEAQQCFQLFLIDIMKCIESKKVHVDPKLLIMIAKQKRDKVEQEYIQRYTNEVLEPKLKEMAKELSSKANIAQVVWGAYFTTNVPPGVFPWIDDNSIVQLQPAEANSIAVRYRLKMIEEDIVNGQTIVARKYNPLENELINITKESVENMTQSIIEDYISPSIVRFISSKLSKATNTIEVSVPKTLFKQATNTTIYHILSPIIKRKLGCSNLSININQLNLIVKENV